MAGLFDQIACVAGGHIWVQADLPDGVMICTRCGDQAAGTLAPVVPQPDEDGEVSASEESDSVIPEDRPWLEPPFTP